MSRVEVRSLTDIGIMNEVAEATVHGKTVKAKPSFWYRSEHSPLRARMFLVKMFDIPTFVSVHLVRHNIGVTHYVSSNRDDRRPDTDSVIDRNSPVTHFMILNAQSLIQISRKRLCYMASKETIATWTKVRKAIRDIDPDLASYMVPECSYRNGLCPEFKECSVGAVAVCKAYER